jgi:hypothetical protein
MKERHYTVPKVAGQFADAGLYETLKDIIRRSGDVMSGIGIDVLTSTLSLIDVQSLTFDNFVIVDTGDQTASIMAYIDVWDETNTTPLKTRNLVFDDNGMKVTDNGGYQTTVSAPGLRHLHGFAYDYVSPVLFYNPTLSNPTLSYVEGTRTLTVTRPTLEGNPVAYNYWYYGKMVSVNSNQSLAHANSTGSHYYTMNTDTGVLQVSTDPWNIMTDIMVAYVYYNATTGKGFCLHELHGKDRNLSLHEYAHTALGTQAVSGFAISGYTLNTSTDAGITYAVATGKVVDEDIRLDSTALADGGPYIILERSGADGDWTWTTTNTLPVIKGTTYPVYNKITTGSWGRTELTGTSNGSWVNYWIFGTTGIDPANRVIIVMGQNVYTTLADAQLESVAGLQWGVIPLAEIVPLYKVTFHAKSGYGGTTACQIEDVQRLVGTKAAISAVAAVTSHNALTGRSDPNTHPASSITFTPYSTISATDVQAAIQELLDEATAGKVMRAQEFTSGTTNFTTASGVTEVWVTGCGGGGGGARGQSSSNGAGGGGGGAHSVYRQKLTVTASTTYSVVIGAGGAGGTNGNGNNGVAGDNTTFGALLTLTGGSGGVTASTAAGGAGGAAGGMGGTRGIKGESYIATYETLPTDSPGGISFPGGYGAGGMGVFNGNGQSGNDGYLLVEWNE